MTNRSEHPHYDVVVIGGGVAGLSASIFTARHGLDTLVVDSGGRGPASSRPESGDASGSLLRRNAHIENFPGFPTGINPRLLLELMGDQATDAGCERRRATVDRVETTEEGFVVETADDDRPFYHDWVTPEGYFTDRGRDLPPGCEE